MKTLNKLLLALLVALAVSCSRDDGENVQPLLPVTMEFTGDHSFPEISEGQQINISFNRPAPVDGTIIIEVTPADATGFVITPAMADGEIELQVAKGATGASFTFEPVDDDVLQGNRTIHFELLQDSDKFLIGAKHSMEVTIFENEVAATAGFAWSNYSILENQTEGLEVPISFSVPVPGQATVKVKVEGEAVGDLLTTVPAMDANNIIEIAVPSGVWDVKIGLQPKDDNVLHKHHNLRFSIIEVSGPVINGGGELALLLRDDELAGKLQSVETINGNNKHLKSLEYDSNGRVKKVVIQENPSGYLLTQNYHYDEAGQLISVSGITGDYDSFIWENGKMVKSEKVVGFFGTYQSFYEYENGRLSRRRDYDLDGNRNATETHRYTYAYHSNGDLKAEVQSSLVNGVWQEISSRTFDSYSEVVHPFPLEAAPGLYLQQHLNLTQATWQNNQTKVLYYVYSYNTEGKVTERNDGSETVKYSYY